MLKSLDVLLRIKQHELDEKRRSLVNLLNEISNLKENDKNLESEMVSEQILAKSTPDSAGMYYGSYVKRVINVRKDIAN